MVVCDPIEPFGFAMVVLGSTRRPTSGGGL